MKDSDIRGIVLQRFYELRKDNAYYCLKQDDLGIIEDYDYNRIGKQLADKGLLEWHEFLSGNGHGRITGAGVDVIEGNASPPLSINVFDHSVAIHSSNNVQVGNSNSLNASINIDINKVHSAIDSSPASPQQKAEAKSIFERLATNPAFASIVGALVAMGGGSPSQ